MTSELSQERQAAIVKILTFLHEGGDFDEAKQMFKDQFDQVDVAEIKGPRPFKSRDTRCIP